MAPEVAGRTSAGAGLNCGNARLASDRLVSLVNGSSGPAMWLENRTRRRDRDLAGNRRLSAGGVVLVGDARRNAPAVTDRDALVPRPRADLGAALTSR